MNRGLYPYPTATEILAIRNAFDNFFRVIETKETDNGVALFVTSGNSADFTPITLDTANAFVSRIVTSVAYSQTEGSI